MESYESEEGVRADSDRKTLRSVISNNEQCFGQTIAISTPGIYRNNQILEWIVRRKSLICALIFHVTSINCVRYGVMIYVHHIWLVTWPTSIFIWFRSGAFFFSLHSSAYATAIALLYNIVHDRYLNSIVGVVHAFCSLYCIKNVRASIVDLR